MDMPWVRFGEPKVEKLESSLSSFSRRDVAGVISASGCILLMTRRCRLSIHVCKLSGDYKSVVPNQRTTCGTNTFLTVGGQWNIARTCMFAGEGPFCLAVADDEHSRSSHVQETANPESGREVAVSEARFLK